MISPFLMSGCHVNCCRLLAGSILSCNGSDILQKEIDFPGKREGFARKVNDRRDGALIRIMLSRSDCRRNDMTAATSAIIPWIYFAGKVCYPIAMGQAADDFYTMIEKARTGGSWRYPETHPEDGKARDWELKYGNGEDHR